MTRAYAQTPKLKVGYVSPKTGPLASFAEADDYIIAGINKAFAGGIENNGKAWEIEIIVRDSQSNPNRAAEVASQLILDDEVDILLGAATPETTNPVADQAEVNGTPCITTDCPWQPYFFGRGGKPDTGFESTYHFFWGLEDVIGNFLALWDHPGVAKIGRRPVPQRRRRQCLGRSGARLPQAAGCRRLHADRSRPLPDR